MNLFQYCFCFWFFGYKACEILTPWPGMELATSALEGELLTTGPPGSLYKSFFLSLLWMKKKRQRRKSLIFMLDLLLCACVLTWLFQSWMTLCDLMGCILPGSSVHGILQARILKWVAMPSYRAYSQSRDQIHILFISCITGRFFTTEPLGKPKIYY